MSVQSEKLNEQEYTAQLPIRNRMGFHVRPVQRFAETARLFKSEVTVQLRSRWAPGKSVMNLMSLGGRCGDVLEVTARGEDARQCLQVLRFLAEERFFVEDDIKPDERPDRHLERLAAIARCFDSEIVAELDGRKADAKDLTALRALGLTPTSKPNFQINGRDAEQAAAVLEMLVRNCFFVEEQMVRKEGKST